ncbi:hypothetical protein ABIF93_002513 [Bradyrhizobium japonicum]
MKKTRQKLSLRGCNSPLRIRPAQHLRTTRRSDHRLQLLAQHAPDHQDAAVALAEMLLGVDGLRALADLGVVIAGELLVLGFRHVPPEFAVEL